ncbi:4287_t:CDS:2, partial [Entrophospora sp. SA101]
SNAPKKSKEVIKFATIKYFMVHKYNNRDHMLACVQFTKNVITDTYGLKYFEDDLISKFKPTTPSITFHFTVNPLVHANLRTNIYFNLPPLEKMEFNTPSLKNSKEFFDAWFESKFYPYYKVHHPSTQKEKVLGFLRSKIYEEFHRRYFEIVTSPPSWDRYTINSLKTRQYAVCQMANWDIKYYKSDEGFETLCDKYWKQSFEKFPIPKTCTHC